MDMSGHVLKICGNVLTCNNNNNDGGGGGGGGACAWVPDPNAEQQT